MSSSTYGAIKLATAEEVGTILKKKMGTQTGYKPKDWADTINLLGKLPIRTASGSIAHFEDGADDVPLKSLTAQIVPIQEGTGDPSPSNPRPISGTSVLNVTRCGSNLFNEDWERGTINDTTGQPTSSDTQIRSKTYSTCKGGATYYIYVGSSNSIRVFWYASDYSYLGQTNNIANATATAPSNACYLKIRGTNAYGTTYLNDISINYPSTDTSYHAYTGSTYTINLGRTVYGGSAEVVGGTGEETYGYIASYNGEEINEPWLSSIDPYVQGTTPSTGAEVVYSLSTPTDFTFEGEEINSLEGVNNIYLDSGEVLDVEYRADIDLLISELGG